MSDKLRVSTIVEFYVKQDIDPHYKVFDDWSAAVSFYNEQLDLSDAKNLPEPVLWDRRGGGAVFNRC